jgi:hypothetical protein
MSIWFKSYKQEIAAFEVDPFSAAWSGPRYHTLTKDSNACVQFQGKELDNVAV